MKALSIKQPWASLICTPIEDNPLLGIKDIENRTWRTHFRGRIYIHASGQITRGKYSEFLPKEYWKSLSILEQNNLIYFSRITSAIIGEVDIIDCVQDHPSIWAEKSLIKPDVNDDKYYNNLFLDNCSFNQKLYNKDLAAFDNSKPIYNWVLANPVLYDKPILNVKGKLSFWEFEPLNP